MLCGLCIAWKRYCCIHWLFTLILSFSILFFLAIGAVLVLAAGIFHDGLTDACNGGSGDIAEAFNELYSNADSLYCVSSASGCVCNPITHVVDPSAQRTSYVTTGGVGAINNVQGCTAHLAAAYADYGIDFDDISEITEYLDYFGDIEDHYDCSGICNLQGVFYFHDVTAGGPGGKCETKIKDELIDGVIGGTGIAYIVTGCFLFCIWFIQYGLCCRKKQQGNPGSGSKKF